MHIVSVTAAASQLCCASYRKASSRFFGFACVAVCRDDDSFCLTSLLIAVCRTVH